MNILKKKKLLIAPGLALLLSTSLYADESYTIKTTSLVEAIKKISEVSKLPYIVDTDILIGKEANPIKNVNNLKSALKLLLENTGLEADVNNETIIIRKVINEKSNNDKKLKDILILENRDARFGLESAFISSITSKDLKKFGGSRNVVNILNAQEHGDASISEATSMGLANYRPL